MSDLARSIGVLIAAVGCFGSLWGGAYVLHHTFYSWQFLPAFFTTCAGVSFFLFVGVCSLCTEPIKERPSE